VVVAASAAYNHSLPLAGMPALPMRKTYQPACPERVYSDVCGGDNDLPVIVQLPDLLTILSAQTHA
jgi:hypothetical protein